MPVTTSYSWGVENPIALPFGQNNVDLAALNNGGFVAINDDGTNIDGFNFDGNGGLWLNSLGTNGSVTQLSNGFLLVASQDADSILYEVRDLSGNVIIASTDIGDTGSTNAVVTATATGFVIASQDFVAGDFDMEARFYNLAGTLLNTAPLAAQVTDNERNAAIATLNNGNVVIAWEDDDAFGNGDDGIQFEIWSPDGATRISGNDVLADTDGTINRNVSVTALANGGFALVYEDTDFQPNGITLATFDATGTAVGRFDITGQGGPESNPEVTTLSNGLLAVSVTSYSFFNSSQTTTLIRLIDPSTGQLLAEDRSIFDGGSTFDNLQDSELVGLLNGRLVVAHENNSNSNTSGEVLQVIRHTTGDDTSNIVNGDAIVDVMTGGAMADFFYGLGADDVLFGRGGADWIYGGDGDDQIDGDAGADLLFGQDGADRIVGGADGDFMYGGNGEDILFGEDGDDWIYGEANDDLIVGHAGADSLFGGTGNDEIHGGAETDSIFGEAGNDTIYGGDGGDVIVGQDGNDQIFGGEGGDFLFGGNDFDTIRGGDGNDQIFGEDFNDLLFGGAGDDYMDGGNFGDILHGGDGGDSMFGQDGIDFMYGDAGGDVLNGGTGNDQLFGGADGDFLFGDSGSDTLNGGTGNDQLYGGSNGLAIPGEVDNFRFDGPGWGNDTIHDYEDGVDRIQFEITAMLNNFGDLTVGTSGGDATLTFGVDSITIVGAAGLITAADVDFLV